MKWLIGIGGMFFLAGCGVETASTAATAAAVKKNEIEQGRRQLEQVQQKLEMAQQQGERRGGEAGEAVNASGR